MKCTSATKFHRKSGVAKWRDLQFSGPSVEMSNRASKNAGYAIRG
jgi:hypothetical protein